MTANAIVGTGVQSLRRPGSPAWQDERYESLLVALVSLAAASEGRLRPVTVEAVPSRPPQRAASAPPPSRRFPRVPRHPARPSWPHHLPHATTPLRPQSNELELEQRAADVGSRLEHVNSLVKFCLHEVR